MMPVILCLPAFAFAILFLIYFGKLGGIRSAYLSTAAVWGALLFGITEILSALGGFGSHGIALAWLAADLVATAWLWHTGRPFLKNLRCKLVDCRQDLRSARRDIPDALVVGCALVAVTTGVIALLCPPNTPDALFYHMPRVINWLNHRNVEYYPTVYVPQLFMPPWAEYAMAHVFALASSDRFVNLVEWFSLLGCGIGVSWIAKQLGAPGRGQVLAATVSISIPQAILQSSSAKNDYVEAFWLVCCISFTIGFKDLPVTETAVMIGLSGGLAMLTKGVAYVYLPPLMFVLFFFWPRRIQISFLKFLPIIAVLCIALNFHHYVRNYAFCGSFAGCPTAEGDNKGLFHFANNRFNPAVTISNIIRNLALHIGTPSEDANRRLTEWLSAGIRVFGIDPNDAGSTWPGEQFRVPKLMLHEDAMANTIHLLIIFATMGVLLFDRRGHSLEIIAYASGLTLAFILFCAYLRWQPWHTRLHLPLFVLWSAIVGVAFGRRMNLGGITASGIALLVLSIPALFENQLRPLLPIGASITGKKRDDLIFAPSSYRIVASLADRTSCRSAGIDARMVFNEYALLRALHIGLSDRSVRTLGVLNNSAKYSTNWPPVEPQCVICIECPPNGEKWKLYEAAGMRGLPAPDLTFFYRPNQVQAESLESYHILLRFPPAQQSKPMPEPLLTLGRFGAADFFYVRYLGDNRVSLGFHHFWVGGPESAPLAITPNVDYVVAIQISNALSWIEMRLDGKSVLSHMSSVYAHSETEIYVGRNPVGGAAAGPAFNGNALALPAEQPKLVHP